MDGFALDYFILVFIASCGVIQIAAAYSRLHGLLILARPCMSTSLGLLLTLTPIIWFFISEPRNVPDTADGLDGNQQAALFTIGAIAAIFVTLVVSSLRNIRMKPSLTHENSGLDALSKSNYVNALYTRIKSQLDKWHR